MAEIGTSIRRRIVAFGSSFFLYSANETVGIPRDRGWLP